jgi:hypothetical protein
MSEQPVAACRDAESCLRIHRELAFLAALTVLEIGHRNGSFIGVAGE